MLPRILLRSISIAEVKSTVTKVGYFFQWFIYSESVILGLEPHLALGQAIKSLDNYRSTLRDEWNFHGLTSSQHYGLDGLPWATSHYTFHLVLWHLPLALSGQQFYAPNGSLTFKPKYEPPYWLPFYTPFCMGNIEASENQDNDKTEILYKLTVSSGKRDIHLFYIIVVP